MRALTRLSLVVGLADHGDRQTDRRRSARTCGCFLLRHPFTCDAERDVVGLTRGGVVRERWPFGWATVVCSLALLGQLAGPPVSVN
jgi:hypothetical protein